MTRFVPGERKTLHGILEKQTTAHADKVALTILGEHLTYEALSLASTRMANGMHAQGLRPGDVIATLAENCVEQAYLQFGTAMSGVIEVMINTSYRGEFLRHQLADCGAKAIIVDGHLLEHVLAVAPDLPDLTQVFVRGDTGGQSSGLPRLSLHPVTELLDASSTRRDFTYSPQWSDPCSIVYTSGTTGPSKGAVLSQHYLVTTSEQMAGMWYEDEDDAFYACTPMFHLAAKGAGMISSISMGARCVLDERFSASNFWRRVREERCTATLLLGSMGMMMWNQPQSEEEGIRVVYAVPMPWDLKAKMEQRWGCRFITAYGLSEANPIVKIDPSGGELPRGASGRPNDDLFDMRIFDNEGCEVAPGVVGEIVVRPKEPHVMFEGYFNNPAASWRVTKQGWFHTGDLGLIDEEGFFHFADRKKDYLRRRGENISSWEVEQAIARHPDVLQVAVVPVPSEMSEDEVKAYVVRRDGSELDHRELIEHCVENMPYFAVPRFIDFIDELPSTPTGKVLKFKLREMHDPAASWDREKSGIEVKRPAPA
ncbi:ATP-dependent acyl-CoA ligase [Nocardioides hungaricus]